MTIKWEWLEQEPTAEEVYESLDSLPLVWGVKTVDYIAHVLPMFANQKQWEDQQGNRTTFKRHQAREVYLPSWKLYMQVAGRIAMANRACELNEWVMDLYPDPTMEPGKVAFGMGSSAVYREFCEFHTADRSLLIGRRPGMAALKSSDKIPPWEKVETAARGRALGAWGFGVLPGSGIASADEMQLAQFSDFRVVESPDPEEIPERDEIKSGLLTALEQYRQMRGRTDDEAWEWLRATAYQSFQVQLDKDERSLDPLSDGQLELLRRRVQSDVRKGAGVGDL